MRVIFPMYDTAFQFATLKRLAIKSLDDFAGLRIGVGPRAGTGSTYVPEIFKILGIAADIRFGAIEQMALQMAEGKLDGVVIAGGFPIPALAELDARQPVDTIGGGVPRCSVSDLWSKLRSHFISRVGTRGHRTINSGPGTEHHTA